MEGVAVPHHNAVVSTSVGTVAPPFALEPAFPASPAGGPDLPFQELWRIGQNMAMTRAGPPVPPRCFGAPMKIVAPAAGIC